MIAACIDCGHSFDRNIDEDWKRRCLSCWAINKAKRTSHATSSTADPLLGVELQRNMRALLSLCHPDRHNNSELSTRVTQWLLSVRRRIECEEGLG